MMNKSISHSLMIHFFVIGVFALMIMTNKKKTIETFSFEMIEKKAVTIKKCPKIVINGAKTAPSKKSETKKTRAVFGVKRKTLTSEKGSVQAKIGNTLTKKEDE